MNQKEYIEKKIADFRDLFISYNEEKYWIEEQAQKETDEIFNYLKQTITELTDLIEEETRLEKYDGDKFNKEIKEIDKEEFWLGVKSGYIVNQNQQKELFKIFRGNEKE